MEIKSKWVLCPACGNKTRLQIREDTELKNFPLYCPKCKQETLIEAKNLHITVITEPDAKTQSRRADEQVSNHKFIGSVLHIKEKQPCGYFSGAVLIKAFAVALTTWGDRSSQAESIGRRFSTSESLDGFSG